MPVVAAQPQVGKAAVDKSLGGVSLAHPQRFFVHI